MILLDVLQRANVPTEHLARHARKHARAVAVAVAICGAWPSPATASSPMALPGRTRSTGPPSMATSSEPLCTMYSASMGALCSSDVPAGR